MPKRQRAAELPREVIPITKYSQLDLYLGKFAAGELGLVLLLGRHGTGKSEGVRRALNISSSDGYTPTEGGLQVLYVEGHMRPYGLYCSLWEYRDRVVVLDDLDKLYADAECVRLLKPLCNTERSKRVTWLSNMTLRGSDIPASFGTTGRVILIANEWRTLNPNVRALEDRAIILHFDPPNSEVHRRVGEWFQDHEVYRFIARILPSIKVLSMRHYCSRPSGRMFPSLISRKPTRIARREIPVARATKEMPPYPIELASVAAQTRRVCSSRREASTRNFTRIAASVVMPKESDFRPKLHHLFGRGS